MPEVFLRLFKHFSFSLPSLIHVTDWLPTLYSAAGGDIKDLGLIDGIDQWNNLKMLGPSSRKEMLYNSNPTGNAPPRAPTGSALRHRYNFV